MQSNYAKSGNILFDVRIRWSRPSNFDPKSDGLGHQIFRYKNGMVSKFQILSTTASSSRTIDELDADTTV